MEWIWQSEFYLPKMHIEKVVFFFFWSDEIVNSLRHCISSSTSSGSQFQRGMERRSGNRSGQKRNRRDEAHSRRASHARAQWLINCLNAEANKKLLRVTETNSAIVLFKGWTTNRSNLYHAKWSKEIAAYRSECNSSKSNRIDLQQWTPSMG